MTTKHSFENLLRAPYELLVALVAAGFGFLCIMRSNIVALDFQNAVYISIPFFVFGILRGIQGSKIYLYQKRLLKLKPFSMGTLDVPLSKENLFLGKGFQWLPMHRQRMHLLSLVENQKFMQKSFLYRYVQKRADSNPKKLCAKLRQIPFLPFFWPNSDIGGKPWLHGVGSDHEHSVFIKQANRNSHTVVFGMTRVGKTRLMSILANQDIRNNEAVLVLDPKGDLEMLQDIFCACKAAGRSQDFIALHAGMPEVSAKYNPLASFFNVSEVATRITGAIQAEGEGKQFKDFAWKFLNITGTCLAEMGENISYKSLAFFVTRPRQLLLAYCDKILPKKDKDYLYKIEEIIKKNSGKIDKSGNPENFTRADAARLYVAQYIESVISKGDFSALHDSIIADLHHAAEIGEEYYGKITASLGPVFDKINKTSAGEVFSWEHSFGLPVINLEDIIKRKQVVYIGLDSMSNKAMSEAVGQAVIADLISLCGRLYKDVPNKNRLLCLHTDEFSEIVRDEFVTLLNKAGGAGIRVTAYTQTVNDLGVAFGSSRDKPKMLLGNFGTSIFLRVANQDTARIFTDCLETIRARSTTPSTMANDRSDGHSGELFTTYNTDTIVESKEPLIVENDLFSLPKGQAFVLTNGGELYKIRIPLPKNDGASPPTFDTLLSEVNLCRG